MAKRYYAFSLYKNSGLYLLVSAALLFVLFYFAAKWPLVQAVGIPILLLVLTVGADVVRFYIPGKIGKSSLSNSYEVSSEGVVAHSIFNLKEKFFPFKGSSDIEFVEFATWRYVFLRYGYLGDPKLQWPAAMEFYAYSDYSKFKEALLTEYNAYCKRNKIKPVVKYSTVLPIGKV